MNLAETNDAIFFSFTGQNQAPVRHRASDHADRATKSKISALLGSSLAEDKEKKKNTVANSFNPASKLFLDLSDAYQ
jgi:hypothetical protein